MNGIGGSLLTSPYLVRSVSRRLNVFSPTHTQYGQCHMELARLITHTHTHTQWYVNMYSNMHTQS